MNAMLLQPGIELMSKTSSTTCFIRRSLLLRIRHPLPTLSRRSGCIFHRTCFAPVATTAVSVAGSTRRVQRDWHVLPDGTKLEVLRQICDVVKHQHSIHMQSFLTRTCHVSYAIQEAGLSTPPLLMLHGAGHAAWCYKVKSGQTYQFWYHCVAGSGSARRHSIH